MEGGEKLQTQGALPGKKFSGTDQLGNRLYFRDDLEDGEKRKFYFQ
jgi:hypothetical protein